jgi:hypothetical protein
VIVKVGSDFVLLPSLTEMRMFENVPATVGVPLRRPVLVLKLAQAGRLPMANVSGWPSGSVAEGWKEYATPTVPVVLGVPEIVGG